MDPFNFDSLIFWTGTSILPSRLLFWKRHKVTKKGGGGFRWTRVYGEETKSDKRKLHLKRQGECTNLNRQTWQGTKDWDVMGHRVKDGEGVVRDQRFRSRTLYTGLLESVVLLSYWASYYRFHPHSSPLNGRDMCCLVDYVMKLRRFPDWVRVYRTGILSMSNQCPDYYWHFNRMERVSCFCLV